MSQQLCLFKVPAVEDLPESCHVFEVDGKAMVICDPAAGDSAAFPMRCVGPEDPAVAALCASPIVVDESDPRSVAMGALYASICGAAQATLPAQGQAKQAAQGQAAQAAQAAQGQAAQGQAKQGQAKQAAQAAQGQAEKQAQAVIEAVKQAQAAQAQAAIPAQAAAAQAQAAIPAQAIPAHDVPISMAIFASVPLEAAMAAHYGASAPPTASLAERYYGH
jgi:hypothetical protein